MDRTEPPRSAVEGERDLCTYLAESCAEFERIADRPRLRTLRYLLDMARLEAERQRDLVARGP